MRRILLLTLLAVALPTAALANSFGFDVGSGGISSDFENPFTVTLYGHGFSQDFLTIKTSSITPDGCPDVCTFSSGSIVSFVYNPAQFTTLDLTSTLFDGKIVHNPDGDNFITARIRGGRGAPFGGTVDASFRDPVVGGYGHVGIGLASKSFPEPSAPEGLLLGTGVLGLAEMARRKLKLGI